ncbi:MAG: hypothetical protein QF859_02670 [Candidatus Marinimicrobia bacterium]|jgi:hypothetical protein|nr:hypothetical protein [Candidatus Neomarinimicrobiota bacterium]MDP7526263.1 hypothetical protein [Candidatus Neomarinimicrobiota bacterium]MEE1505453.1 hypothetical protein [Candidatus Neomarinimicrobiota bacterium]|tara:strand:- start:470 stop:595 length:126 start_codon:yes stop_codon:yes gene_type:complete
MPIPKDYHQAVSNLVEKFHNTFTGDDTGDESVKQGVPTLKD